MSQSWHPLLYLPCLTPLLCTVKYFSFVSELLNVEHDEILAESIEDAMEQFDDMVIEHIKEKIAYYNEMLDKFQEKK